MNNIKRFHGFRFFIIWSSEMTRDILRGFLNIFLNVPRECNFFFHSRFRCERRNPHKFLFPPPPSPLHSAHFAASLFLIPSSKVYTQNEILSKPNSDNLLFWNICICLFLTLNGNNWYANAYSCYLEHQDKHCFGDEVLPTWLGTPWTTIFSS